MTAYTAHATPDGELWLVHVPEVQRYTQARSVDEIETMARDLVAVMTGEDPSEIDIEVT